MTSFSGCLEHHAGRRPIAKQHYIGDYRGSQPLVETDLQHVMGRDGCSPEHYWTSAGGLKKKSLYSRSTNYLKEITDKI